LAPLLTHAPASAEPSDLLLAFMAHCEAAGVEPYPAQFEAFEAIFEHKSVVLATPTGSGKSLVALAAQFAAFWRGHRGLDPTVPEHLRRSVYTAPTKALVNEKFFNLCDAFGATNVGLMTGDATVNAAAPVVCCTAEILESMALRQGTTTPFGWVVMDEFHYFSDPGSAARRGWCRCWR
jgi:superfamily II RNA helicase